MLISPEDLESLEETLAVLGDSDAVAELVGAHRVYLERDVVRGVDAVTALRPGDRIPLRDCRYCARRKGDP